MLCLVLAIISSMLVSVCMRIGEARAKNKTSMLAANYLCCTLLAGLFAGSFSLSGGGVPVMLALGLVSGFFYLVSFLMMQWNVSRNGVVLTATFMKLGILVPTLLAVAVFRETPSVLQIVGFLLALAAILMIQLDTSKGPIRAGSGLGLVALLLCGGLGDGMSKFYEAWGAPALSGAYLQFTFLTALVLCVLLCLKRRERLTPTDALWGVIVGVPNYFSSRFLLMSLSSVPAVVAYPTFSVGTIVAVTLVGLLIFRERLSRRQIAALAVILAALALLNL